MTQLAIDRRGLGAFGLVASAGLTATGTLLPLYQFVDSSGGGNWQVVITAWQTVVTPIPPSPVVSWAPQFGFPLALAAIVEVVAALLLFRTSAATALVGRMAAIAGSAILLGGAWSTMLFFTMLTGRGGTAPQPNVTESIGIGLWLIGAAWVVSAVGAVLVQDLPTGESESESESELVPEPEYLDEAVVYRIDGTEASDEVDTPPLGFPELSDADRFVVLVEEDRGGAPRD